MTQRRFESIDQIPATFAGLELIRQMKATTRYAGQSGGYALIAECERGHVTSFDYVGPTSQAEAERWLLNNSYVATR